MGKMGTQKRDSKPIALYCLSLMPRILDNFMVSIMKKEKENIVIYLFI